MSVIDLDAAKEARKGRKAFAASPLSAFVRTMRKVITQYLGARASGVSQEDGIRGIEEELRAAWPKSVSKFVPDCNACDDTGWEEKTCWDQQRCGRRTCADNPARLHLYVVPCRCMKGDRFRPRVWQPEDQIAAVGKTQKAKRGFSRLGQ
jgi:hypothetical protein